MSERFRNPSALRQIVSGLAASLLILAFVAQTTVSHVHSQSSEAVAVEAADADYRPASTAAAAAACPACSLGYGRVGVSGGFSSNALPVVACTLRLSADATALPAIRLLRTVSAPRAPPLEALSLA